MKHKLSIGFSPCPNDTFMFDAMINDKLANGDFQFDVHMGDIEQLNTMAFDRKLDITKLSYHALIHLTDDYQILTSGSALGNNCGPLLLGKTPLSIEDVSKKKIAIPGEFTTANMLLNLAFPNIQHKEIMLFSDIEDAVLDEQVDLGLVIHENRFTYKDKGLHKIMDLGEFWENLTQLPIPLGAIVIKRSLPEKLKQDINTMLRESIQYAFDQPKSASSFIKTHAQAMDEDVMYQHIDLYVNDYSLDIGKKGKASVKRLFELMVEKGNISKVPSELFVEA